MKLNVATFENIEGEKQKRFDVLKIQIELKHMPSWGYADTQKDHPMALYGLFDWAKGSPDQPHSYPVLFFSEEQALAFLRATSLKQLEEIELRKREMAAEKEIEEAGL